MHKALICTLFFEHYIPKLYLQSISLTPCSHLTLLDYLEQNCWLRFVRAVLVPVSESLKHQ